MSPAFVLHAFMLRRVRLAVVGCCGWGERPRPERHSYDHCEHCPHVPLLAEHGTGGVILEVYGVGDAREGVRLGLGGSLAEVRAVGAFIPDRSRLQIAEPSPRASQGCPPRLERSTGRRTWPSTGRTSATAQSALPSSMGYRAVWPPDAPAAGAATPTWRDLSLATRPS